MMIKATLAALAFAGLLFGVSEAVFEQDAGLAADGLGSNTCHSKS